MSSLALVVKAGSCMNGGDGRICAFQPSDCPPDTNFVTPRSLEQGGGSRNSHGGACTSRVGSEETAKIGSCQQGGQACASHASVCSDPSAFVAVDDRCTIRKDGLKGGRNTRFGRCGADDQCYWSSQDCSDPSSWMTVNENNSNSCTCDKVRVGACYDQSFYYCAVDSSACATTSGWINAKDLATTADAPECFLCHAEESLPVATSPNEPVGVETPSPTRSPVVPAPFSALASNSGRSSSSSNQKAVIGASIGGGVLAVVFVGLAFYMFRRRRRGPPPTKKETSDIPVDTITGKDGDMSDQLSDIED